MVNKPESKIKSITGEGREFTALFEDGSVWLRYYHKNTNEYLWECILEAHKEQTPIDKIRDMPNIEPVEEELEKSDHEYPHYYKKGESKCIKCGVEEESTIKDSLTVDNCNYCKKELDPEYYVGDHCCSWDCANNLENEIISKKETAKKLPEVGKRYKQFSSYGYWILKRMCIERTPGGKREAILNSSDGLCTITFDLKKDFWAEFKELPDQEPTTEEYLTVDKEPNKATESKKPLLSKEAQEALDELKHALGCWDYSGKWPTRDGEYGYVFDTARTLVNALESKDKKEWPKCKNPSGVFELCTFEDGKCTGCGELEGEG